MTSAFLFGHFSLYDDVRKYYKLIVLRLSGPLGRTTAQAVSRWLPTSAARVRSQVRSCGICGGQSSNGAGFLRVVRFPLPILIPPNAPYSSIIRGWYNRPISGRRSKWNQSHPTPRNVKNKASGPFLLHNYRYYKFRLRQICKIRLATKHDNADNYVI
jgi:hypothetical protein